MHIYGKSIGFGLLIFLSNSVWAQESQTLASWFIKPATEILIELPGLPTEAVPLVLVRISAGSFMMGSPDTEEGRDADEGPEHSVTISKDFFIGKFEVTQAQWTAVMGENSSTQKGPNLPVNKVSWNDCQAFMAKLNQLKNTAQFRLPTEAEHEYVRRSGVKGTGYPQLIIETEEWDRHAWYRGNSEGELHPVGQLIPSPWGLYDLFGNVWEWCQDGYAPYSAEPVTDPIGEGAEKVHRGASWMARPDYLRAADRGKFPLDARYNTGGFRLAKSE